MPDANASGSAFYYAAFGAGPNFRTGSYIGDGLDNRTIPAGGLLPDFVSVKGDSDLVSSVARWRATGRGFRKPGFADNTSLAYAELTFTSQDAIQQMLRGGFQVGVDDDVNALNIPYYWVALDAAVPPGVAPGDVELVSVNVAAPPTANAGVQFVVSASAHLLNHGPASSVLVDTNLRASVSTRVQRVPWHGHNSKFDASCHVDVDVNRAWNVTCSQPGTYEFRFNVTVASDPSQQTPDADPSNNSGSGMGTTQVN